MAEEKSKNRVMPVRGHVRALGAALAFACVALVAGEAGARFDDWLFDDVPFFDHPSFDALYVRDEARLRRGRPGARWKQVRLNNLGLRGKDVSSEPRSGCRRLMFLGASETFGNPSIAGDEFPARVANRAAALGCVEVLNTAIPGMSPQTLNRYYRSRFRQLRPDTVYVYASTHFYLSERLPRVAAAESVPTSPVAITGNPPRDDARSFYDKSRLLERLRDSFDTPEFVQRRLDRKRVAQILAGEPDPTEFATVPAERLELLASDLRELVASIRESGAEPVLMTHAVRVTSPPRAVDHDDLDGMRVYVPRASARVLAAFEYAAADIVREVARETNTRLIDVARDVSGSRDLFIDLVHFAPRGQERVSTLIVEDLESAH